MPVCFRLCRGYCRGATILGRSCRDPCMRGRVTCVSHYKEILLLSKPPWGVWGGTYQGGTFVSRVAVYVTGNYILFIDIVLLLGITVVVCLLL
jgi:hypothetical protein